MGFCRACFRMFPYICKEQMTSVTTILDYTTNKNFTKMKKKWICTVCGYVHEGAEHAAKFAELLGDVVWDTKTNLEKRKDAECGACEDKKRIATRAKQLNLDAIHDTVHEMCKDEARHGKGFEGLYNRYFK